MASKQLNKLVAFHSYGIQVDILYLTLRRFSNFKIYSALFGMTGNFERKYNDWLATSRPWQHSSRPAWSYYYRPWLHYPYDRSDSYSKSGSPYCTPYSPYSLPYPSQVPTKLILDLVPTPIRTTLRFLLKYFGAPILRFCLNRLRTHVHEVQTIRFHDSLMPHEIRNLKKITP